MFEESCTAKQTYDLGFLTCLKANMNCKQDLHSKKQSHWCSDMMSNLTIKLVPRANSKFGQTMLDDQLNLFPALHWQLHMGGTKCQHIFSTSRSSHGICILASVVQRADSAIHQINYCPVDSAVCFVNTYPLDSDRVVSTIHALNNLAQIYVLINKMDNLWDYLWNG